MYTITLQQNIINLINDKMKIVGKARYNSIKKRGHTKNVCDIIKDFQIGTKAEWATYELLKKRGHKVTKPDLELRSEIDRRHDADIIVNNKRLHVKCDRYVQYSWSFEKNYIDNSNNFSDKDLLALVHRVTDNTYNILQIYKMQSLKELNLFYPPVSDKLKNKTCLYFYNTKIKRLGITTKGLNNIQGLLK